MKVLVTGGAGYVGSVLVPALLQQGYRVRVLDRLSFGGESLLPVWSDPHFEFVRGDVADHPTVQRALEGIEAVVHLAAIVGDPACAVDPELSRRINRDASLFLFEESRRRGVSRFVFASTCSNYGRMADPASYVDEGSELMPVSLYAETKVEVELELLKAPYSAGGTAPTIMRFATVYGVSPRMRFDLTVNEFTAEMLVKGHLVVFGEQFYRPYIHVMDIARALSMVLKAPAEKVAGEVFNVGSTDENYRKQELVEMIQAHVPGAAIEYVHKDEDPRDYRVSFRKIAHHLDFENLFTVNDGIREVAGAINSGVIADFTDPRYRNT